MANAIIKDTELRGGTDWIQTYTGRQFWPLAPRAEEVCVEDIAHALSNMCRFTGHVKEFYSVAQHSVWVSMLVPPKDALWGLLHDASEAYLVDLPRPVKRSPGLGELYRDAERRLMAVICEKFGLPIEEPASIKLADTRMLHTERRDLLLVQRAWRDGAEPLAETLHAIPPKEAERSFLYRFSHLNAWRP